jgi:hypothetical protein
MEMFNALKYTKQLEQVGLTREQAEAHVQMVIEVMDSNFATKTDFNELKGEIHILRTDLNSFKTEVKSEFAAVRSELKSEIARLQYNLLVKLGVLFATVMGLGFTAIGLLIKFQ